MILENTVVAVDADGLQETKSFNIKASQKAFDILGNKLYSDKFAAVVREISSNAYDAHIEAGKGDVPFHVHLPTEFEPWFSVRDFGIGMAHETVMNLYSTLFESTKSGTNDLIGAFGIGSKSPFAYTDQFTVISRFNGEERIYTAYKHSKEGPSISLAASSPTDECNGVEIRLMVERGDSSKFHEAANLIFPWFPVPPVISPDTFSLRLVHQKYDNYFWIPADYRNPAYASRSTQLIVYGNVAYPVDLSKVFQPIFDPTDAIQRYDFRLIIDLASSIANRHRRGYKMFPEEQAIVAHFNKTHGPGAFAFLTLVNNVKIVPIFNIGDLEVSASREELGYDKKTIDALKSTFCTIGSGIESEVISSISKYLLDSKTTFEMKAKYTDILKNGSADIANTTGKDKFLAEVLKVVYRYHPFYDHKGNLLTVLPSKIRLYNQTYDRGYEPEFPELNAMIYTPSGSSNRPKGNRLVEWAPYQKTVINRPHVIIRDITTNITGSIKKFMDYYKISEVLVIDEPKSDVAKISFKKLQDGLMNPPTEKLSKWHDGFTSPAEKLVHFRHGTTSISIDDFLHTMKEDKYNIWGVEKSKPWLYVTLNLDRSISHPIFKGLKIKPEQTTAIVNDYVAMLQLICTIDRNDNHSPAKRTHNLLSIEDYFVINCAKIITAQARDFVLNRVCYGRPAIIPNLKANGAVCLFDFVTSLYSKLHDSTKNKIKLIASNDITKISQQWSYGSAGKTSVFRLLGPHLQQYKTVLNLKFDKGTGPYYSREWLPLYHSLPIEWKNCITAFANFDHCHKWSEVTLKIFNFTPEEKLANDVRKLIDYAEHDPVVCHLLDQLQGEKANIGNIMIPLVHYIKIRNENETLLSQISGKEIESK